MKHFSLMLVMVLFVMSTALAQRTVTGTVLLDGDGEAIGANVVVDGDEGVGTVTEFDGTFSLSIPETAKALKISYTGFDTQVISVEGVSTINVTLLPDSELITEVVVVGYGVQSKEELTGAVATIDAEQINELPVASLDQALQGQASGVMSTSGDGQPGGVSNVRIRGVGSINAGSAPLYVVDGVPITIGTTTTIDADRNLNALASINPGDIESISILKDAAATAIYGARGSNGVILITTKSGKKGEKTSINFSSQFGVSQKTNDNFRMLNSAEYLELRRESQINAGQSVESVMLELPDSLANVDTDWRDEAFQTGLTKSVELSAKGGTEKTNFYVSAGYFDQEGILINTGLERMSGRININHQANDKLSFGVNLSGSFISQDGRAGEGSFMDPVTGAYLLLPFDSVKDEDGEYNYNFLYNTLQGANFVGISEAVEQVSQSFRLLNSTSISYDITDDWTISTRFGIDWLDGLENEYYGPELPGVGRYDGGYNIRASSRDVTITNVNTVNYNKIFNEKHSVGGLAGFEVLKNEFDYFSATGVGYSTNVLQVLDAAATPQAAFGNGSDYSFMSILSRINYGYAGKYNASASFRRDGSSRFGANNRWANFWSLGAGWSISEESFLNDVSMLDNLKLRASIGTSGNAEIGNFRHLSTYGATSYNDQNGSAPNAPGSADLRWESNLNWNIGLDFALLKRIRGSVEYYNRKTFDLLYEQPISRTTGFTSILGNIAEMVNKGVEAELSVDIFNKGDFYWAVGGSVSLNKNEVTKLVDADGDGQGDPIDGGTFTLREGESIRTFYLIKYAGVHPADGTPLYYDENGNVTGDRTQAGQQIVGSANPKAFGNFTTNLSYKGIGLDVLFFYNYGNKIYDSTRRYIESDGAFITFNQTANQLDRWQNPGDVTDVPQIIFQNTTGGNEWGSTRLLHDGSYLRLKNIRLSYSIPTDKIKHVNKIQVFAQGQNFLTFSKYKGFDPEFSSGGTAFFRYPIGKTVTFGLNVGF